MYVILSEELRQKYDIFLWNERKGNKFLTGDFMKEQLEDMDEWGEEFSLSDEVKMLLFNLGEKGEAVSENRLRIKIIEEVLQEKGFKYEVVTIKGV